MDRLLMMRLQVQGCSAEALLNDIPVARVGPAGGVVCLPVHEYLLEGTNELSLVIGAPAPGAPPKAAPPQLAEGVVGARLRLLLPRTGQVGSDQQARTVAEVVWGVPDGDVFTTPLVIERSISLPVKFPRWRWLDAPVVEDAEAQRALVGAFIQTLALDLMRGEVENFLTASRLRLEELAQAYQQSVADLTGRLRARLQLLHATKALKIAVPAATDLVLRKCAYGRLIECMANAGQPALTTAPTAQGVSTAWPVRVAVVNGRCHILR